MHLASHMHAGSMQVCVQGNMIDQVLELGIRTVGNRQWLVRPWEIKFFSGQGKASLSH